MIRRAFQVRRKWQAAADVCGLELTPPADAAILADVEPGAHVEFFIPQPGGAPELVRHYSLCNAPGERDAYVFGIKLEPASRGGSAYIHSLREGDAVVLGKTRNHFPLSREAGSHLLLAGGIGVTPILAMMQSLMAQGDAFELHYFVRAPEHVAFLERLQPAMQLGRLFVHAALDAGQTRKTLESLLDARRPDAHAYCCGPGPFMDAVADIGSTRWPAECLHFERFQGDANALAKPQEAFSVVLKRRGITCEVKPGQTIIAALSDAGCEVDTSCEQGVCGTCLCTVIEGVPDHRDAYLSMAERESGRQMLPCVSRSLTPTLVLDL